MARFQTGEELLQYEYGGFGTEVGLLDGGGEELELGDTYLDRSYDWETGVWTVTLSYPDADPGGAGPGGAALVLAAKRYHLRSGGRGGNHPAELNVGTQAGGVRGNSPARRFLPLISMVIFRDERRPCCCRTEGGGL